MNETIHHQPGIFVPAHVLQHPALNPAMVCTWMQLRLLVGRVEHSTPVGIQELVAHIGKSSSTIYDHLAALRRADLVRWRFASRGRMIFSFPEEVYSENLENRTIADSRKLDSSEDLNRKNGSLSRKLENGPTPSPENRNMLPASDQVTGANSEKLADELSLVSEKPESSPEIWHKPDLTAGSDPGTGVDTEILDDNPAPSPENWNDALSLKPLINNININNEEVLREAHFPKTGPGSGNLEKEAVRAYRQVLGLRPNQAQRAAIGGQVQDLELWQATLEHWQMHRWNPKNIPGLLELYARAGPQGCRFCQQKVPETGLAALTSLRREYASGERG